LRAKAIQSDYERTLPSLRLLISFEEPAGSFGMVWRTRERDPRSDRAAADVMAAYQAATEKGLPIHRCHRAGVEAWRRAHPDHSAAYAAKQAVAVILAAKQNFLLRVG
jgi:hypothetical protein